jgi:hypothetical protein
MTSKSGDMTVALRRIAEAQRLGATHLDLSDLLIEALPEQIEGVNTLKELSLNHFTTDPFFANSRISKLSSLSRFACSLMPLKSLTCLEQIRIQGCSALDNLEPLADLRSLRILKLVSCKHLTDLKPLQMLSALTRLDLMFCDNIKTLVHLSALRCLRSFSLSECGEDLDLSPLCELPQLASLTLSTRGILPDCRPVEDCSGLELLWLAADGGMCDLEFLENCANLWWLEVLGCDRLNHLHSLSGLRRLKVLHLSPCPQVLSIGPLAELTHLCELELHSLDRVVDVSPLRKLPALTILILISCRSFRSFAPLRPLLPQLEILDLSYSEFGDLPSRFCDTKYKSCVLEDVRQYYAQLEGPYATGIWPEDWDDSLASTQSIVEVPQFLRGKTRKSLITLMVLVKVLGACESDVFSCNEVQRTLREGHGIELTPRHVNNLLADLERLCGPMFEMLGLGLARRFLSQRKVLLDTALAILQAAIRARK